MAVRRRGRGWAVEIYDAGRASGKRYVGTFPTQREARDAERQAQSSLVSRPRAGTSETVAGFASRWLDLRPRQKESTNISYREQINPFVAEHGDCRLDEITVELAYEWMGRKRWTLNGIRAMFSDARRMGLVDSNPFAGLRLRGVHGVASVEVV